MAGTISTTQNKHYKQVSLCLSESWAQVGWGVSANLCTFTVQQGQDWRTQHAQTSSCLELINQRPWERTQEAVHSRSTVIKTAHSRSTAIKTAHRKSASIKKHTVGQHPSKYAVGRQLSKQCTVGQHPSKKRTVGQHPSQQHTVGQHPSKQHTVDRQPSGVPPTVSLSCLLFWPSSVPATSPAPGAGLEEAAAVGRPPAWRGGRQPFTVGWSSSGGDCESPWWLKSSLLLQPNSSLLQTHISLICGEMFI